MKCIPQRFFQIAITGHFIFICKDAGHKHRFAANIPKIRASSPTFFLARWARN